MKWMAFRWQWAVAAGCLAYLASGLFYVSADEQAVVIRLGRFLPERIQPGLHYALPYPVDRVVRLKTSQARRLSIGSRQVERTLGSQSPQVEDYVLTGDQNLVEIQASVQYFTAEPKEYLFRSERPEAVLENLFARSVARAVARVAVDDLLTTQRIRIQNEIQKAFQEEAGRLGMGITITAVSLENVRPPEEVREAFLRVASAREDRNRIVQEAEGYASQVLPRARGEADAMTKEAEIFKAALVHRAHGDSRYFLSLLGEQRKQPEVTATRVYLEAMEQILPRLRKVIVDSEQIELDIFEIEQSSGKK